MPNTTAPVVKLQQPFAAFVAAAGLALVVIASGCDQAGRPGDGKGTASQPPVESAPVVPGPVRSDGEGIESVAHLSRGTASGKTGFERLGPDSTGIDFRHEWRPQKRYEHERGNAFMGGGVCTGDYDGDGLPDVYLSKPTGGGRLYRNLGGFRFEDVTQQAGVDDGKWATGPAFADVDNDGDLDLYICGYDTPNRLYINQGDGTFVEGAQAAGLDFNGASVMTAFADYDNDGDLDAYLVTNRLTPLEKIDYTIPRVDGKWVVPEHLRELMDVLVVDGEPITIMAGQRDRLYRNNGDGTFTDVTESAGIAGTDYGLSATWWDYNHDGKPDIYVANDYWGQDYLYRNNGDGTFTDVAGDALPHTPWFSMGADVADINNDGLLDFMGSDMASKSHFKTKVSMGDMEQNTWFLTFAHPRQYMRNAVYLNTGTERFMEVGFLTGLASTEWTWAIKFGDLDCDGLIDVYVTNGMNRNWNDADVLNQANAVGGLESREGRQIWTQAPRLNERNVAYRNQGDLKFEQTGKTWGLDHLGVSFGAAMLDLDLDGDLDIVTNNYQEQVGIYRSQAAQGNSIVVRLKGTRSNRFGVGALVTAETELGMQARYLTLSRGYMSADEPVAHFGVGDLQQVNRLVIRWPSGSSQVFEGLEVNRSYTVTEPDEPASVERAAPVARMFERTDALRHAKHQERPYDDFKRQPLLPNQLSQLGPGMAWGDIDGDGDDDLYLGGAAGQMTSVLRNNGDDGFSFAGFSPFDQDDAHEDMGGLFFDADGDGDLDLYVVSGGVECEPDDPLLRDRLYLNDGVGAFVRSGGDALPDVRDSGSTVTAADFDRDGDLDLFVGGRVVPGRYPVTPNSRLLRNDGGRFIDSTDQLAPGLRQSGMVTGSLWSDANGDGWIDLLVTYEWGPVRVWLNERGRLTDRTIASGLAGHVGWFNGIAGGDLDHDGDIDYIATNVGLNTKYHASSDKPILLYYGDLGGTGNMRLVEAEYEGDICYPVRGRSCSSNAMPYIKDQFPTFKDFAAAPLQKIYRPDRLADALKQEANTLESLLLVNDGAGVFEVRALPRLAQAAPGFGAIVTDVDGDGHADAYLVQNFYGPQPETGRMDGGVSLLLRGNGDGSLEPVRPDRSGLVVPGDATALSYTDLNRDGWPDFVVATNDAAVMTFQHNGSQVNRLLRVRLRGRLGNHTAVGARITVERDDGVTQTGEVYAGGGYLSQSSPWLVFGLGPKAEASGVLVRWSDGRETTQTPQPGARSIVISDQP